MRVGVLKRLRTRVSSGDPLSEAEQRYLLKAMEQLLAKAERLEKTLEEMRRSRYRDMLLSGFLGWAIGFVMAHLLRVLGWLAR